MAIHCLAFAANTAATLPPPVINPHDYVFADPVVNLQAVQAVGPHTAPLGMRFYRWAPNAFPRDYDSVAFIAEHGSWNRDVKIGYRVMMLRVNNETGAVTEYKPFASGWLQNEGMKDSNFTWGECKG
jgi:glucose/arabinose dehydrogenase